MGLLGVWVGRSMTRAHERFVGARLLVTFVFAVLTQCIAFLVIIRLGLWGFLLTPFFLLAYIAFFGRAFLLVAASSDIAEHNVAVYLTDHLHDCSALLLIHCGRLRRRQIEQRSFSDARAGFRQIGLTDR